jgi:transposase
MAHGRPRDPRKEQLWGDYVRLWQRSGLTIRAFCQRHHLSQPRFYAWRRQLQQRQATAQFVPVHVIPDPPAAAHHGIEIVLAGGRCLRVRADFDPATLRQVLAVLDEEAPPC